MRYFLTLLLLSSSLTVFAQSSNEASLFPELNAIKPNDVTNDPKTTLKEDGELLDADIDMESLMAENDLIEANLNLLAESEEESTEETSEEEGKEEGDDGIPPAIVWNIDDVQATLTPNRNSSFCSCLFGVFNYTKKKLEKFSGTITIGGMRKKFNFSGIDKKQLKVARYTFVGTPCEKILDQPEINVQKCQVEGWTEKKCKSHVLFVPFPDSRNNLE